jgi:hypothetical protein
MAERRDLADFVEILLLLAGAQRYHLGRFAHRHSPLLVAS